MLTFSFIVARDFPPRLKRKPFLPLSLYKMENDWQGLSAVKF
jgi:hypothetical protein